MDEIKYYEVEFDDGYSIAIKGIKKPTKWQATRFLRSDMKQLNLKKVVNILEITKEEAFNFFDMENEVNFPIFGVTKK
jgi:hypothetical protein